MVFTIMLWPDQICETDAATLFLILVSEITIAILGSDRAYLAILLSLQR